MVGGARGVRDQPRPLGRLDRGRRPLDPDVLADRQPDLGPADIDRHRLIAGSEVALLVEDGVVRQPALAIDVAHAAVGEHRQRVVGLPVTVLAGGRLGEADQGDDPGHAPRQLLEHRAIPGLDEVALEVEVLGRVAGDAELGEDDEVGAALACPADPIGDLGRVAVDVPDGGVDLGERDAHQRWVTT